MLHMQLSTEWIMSPVLSNRIDAAAAAEILGIEARAVHRLARAGYLTRIVLPACRPRFDRDEVKSLAAASVQPRTKKATPW
jgi:predicted site-specific integrase-resolvase